MLDDEGEGEFFLLSSFWVPSCVKRWFAAASTCPSQTRSASDAASSAKPRAVNIEIASEFDISFGILWSLADHGLYNLQEEEYFRTTTIISSLILIRTKARYEGRTYRLGTRHATWHSRNGWVCAMLDRVSIHHTYNVTRFSSHLPFLISFVPIEIWSNSTETETHYYLGVRSFTFKQTIITSGCSNEGFVLISFLQLAK